MNALLERQRLLARIEQQRLGIESSFAGLARPASLIDRAGDIGRFLRSHPAAVASLAAGIFVLRGRSLLALLTRGIALWRIARRVQDAVRRLGY